MRVLRSVLGLGFYAHRTGVRAFAAHNRATMATAASLGRDDVLRFWFGDVYFEDRSALNQPGYMPSRTEFWYTGGEEVDKASQPFVELVRAAGRQELDGEEWEEPSGKVARVLLCDQLARSAFRGTNEAFEYDHEAVRIAKACIDNGEDRPELLTVPERWFLYVSLMHHEDRESQALCVSRARAVQEDHPDLAEELKYSVSFAVEHNDVIQRFGRYPHRNKVLGRESTPEEKEFLAQGDLPGWMKSQG